MLKLPVIIFIYRIMPAYLPPSGLRINQPGPTYYLLPNYIRESPTAQLNFSARVLHALIQ